MEESQKRDKERVDNLQAELRDLANQMGSDRDARYTDVGANRTRLLESQKEEQRTLLLKTEQAQADADARRHCALKERSHGSPTLRLTRELAQRQAARVARIDEAEREALRWRLDGEEASAPPSARNKATDWASLVPSRPTTPRCAAGPRRMLNQTAGSSSWVSSADGLAHLQLRLKKKMSQIGLWMMLQAHLPPLPTTKTIVL